jgi:hypothetical protein
VRRGVGKTPVGYTFIVFGGRGGRENNTEGLVLVFSSLSLV